MFFVKAIPLRRTFLEFALDGFGFPALVIKTYDIQRLPGDIDGNQIIDYALGYGPLILGHRHPRVVRAVKEQVDRGSMFGSPTELPAEYVKLVRKAMPSMEMFRFTNSGCEATMTSLRLARAYTGKEKIAKAEGSYHGGYDYMMQSVDIPEDRLKREVKCQPAVPWGNGLPRCMSDLAVIYPFNEWTETEEILRENANELAAVIAEPIHAGGGCVTPRDDYLKKLRTLTKELGILLIFDEVLTGFRVAWGGAQERYGVRPDLTCIAKVAGGGYQLGGFGGRKDIMEEIVPDDVYQMRAVYSRWIADPHVQVVLTTGGTGVTGRDSTPEAVAPLLD